MQNTWNTYLNASQRRQQRILGSVILKRKEMYGYEFYVHLCFKLEGICQLSVKDNTVRTESPDLTEIRKQRYEIQNFQRDENEEEKAAEK